ncbi:hypothetical protein H6G91_10450 [Nostoc muscorum FACHB-395]|uniref:hypothetical protein n=1 Tax=Nostoc sp. C057 TaxID=2576903 RepID=UPI0015C4035E|nr:hypothetical protein [Nostoc sp. C057]MBD2507688.1 hypothetical protein [Desmonostoc muscorum FACHB-395]
MKPTLWHNHKVLSNFCRISIAKSEMSDRITEYFPLKSIAIAYGTLRDRNH